MIGRSTLALALFGLAGSRASAETVVQLVAGEPVGELVAEEAAGRGMTLIDLSDAWTPPIFRPEVPYRETMVALENEALGAGDIFRHAREDRYYELFGIFPSLDVIRARLADELRHRCHEAIADAELAGASLPLPASGPAVRVVQEHLACDGLLAARAVDGRFGPLTRQAVALYRLRHMLPATGALDEETRRALLTSSRELDFRALLRALRERVVHATGLIEDGSAAGAWGQVLGRDLDAAELREAPPAPCRGAADLISPATDAAARALGWTSPEAAANALRDGLPDRRIAVALPPPPAYHADGMPLRAEIDRGDLRRAFARRRAPVTARPWLVLYADTAQGPLALVRWPTTIGGWQREKTARGVVWRYKESQPGDFVWRDVVVAPAWFPPPSTPDRELVRRGADGRWELREDTFGPGYRSAYGLVMLMHHEVRLHRGQVVYDDTAVRTHGSVSYGSLRGGASHGCHRLYNHLAVRLAGFVLAHRQHEVLGSLVETYTRRVVAGGRALWIRRELRGFGYRLRQPVPVRVLEDSRDAGSGHFTIDAS